MIWHSIGNEQMEEEKMCNLYIGAYCLAFSVHFLHVFEYLAFLSREYEYIYLFANMLSIIPSSFLAQSYRFSVCDSQKVSGASTSHGQYSRCSFHVVFKFLSFFSSKIAHAFFSSESHRIQYIA